MIATLRKNLINSNQCSVNNSNIQRQSNIWLWKSYILGGGNLVEVAAVLLVGEYNGIAGLQ